jgi:hypothetical protein
MDKPEKTVVTLRFPNGSEVTVPKEALGISRIFSESKEIDLNYPFVTPVLCKLLENCFSLYQEYFVANKLDELWAKIIKQLFSLEQNPLYETFFFAIVLDCLQITSLLAHLSHRFKREIQVTFFNVYFR